MRNHGDILFVTFAEKPLAIRRVASLQKSLVRSVTLRYHRGKSKPGEFQISIEIPDLESRNVLGYIFL